WSIHGRILPFLEEGSAYDQVRLDIAWEAQKATGVPGIRISTYLCPSELNDFVRILSGQPAAYPQNYGFNLGTWLVYDPTTGRGGDGAFAVNGNVRVANILDGTSYTLCAAEVKTYTPIFYKTNDPGPRPPSAPADLAAFALGAVFKMGPQPN